MAVRIALQCSESDAHLILSETNSRRQAALPARRGDLQRRQRRARGQPLLPGRLALRRAPRGLPEADPRPGRRAQADRSRARPIVFEGDAAADLPAQSPAPAAGSKRPPGPTRRDRARPGWATPSRSRTRPPALFRRQGGNHLLIVGQNDEAALGVMVAALISLAAQFPPADVRHRPLGAQVLRPRRHARGRSCTPRPSPGPRRRAAAQGRGRRLARRRAILAAVAGEVARRQQPDAGDGPEIFLLIHDLPRFRDLRRKRGRLRLLAARTRPRRRRPPRRDPPRRPGAGRPPDHLVRHREQPEPLLRQPDRSASSRCACSSR